MLDDAILNSYCQTFAGYGQWLAPVWFVGIEEAGGKTESEIRQRLDVWVSRGSRELEDATAFYPESGNSRWHGSDATAQPTWKQLIRMLLLAQGKATTPNAILDYQRNLLGKFGGETCLVELFPLPAPSLQDWLYAPWSRLPWLESRIAYEKEVLSGRINLLRQRIDRFQPSVVVFYGDGQLRHWQRIIGAGTYRRPIPGKLIGHQRDGLQFFVTKHPACPGFLPSVDDCFDEVGRFLHTHCPQCFKKPLIQEGK